MQITTEQITEIVENVIKRLGINIEQNTGEEITQTEPQPEVIEVIQESMDYKGPYIPHPAYKQDIQPITVEPDKNHTFLIHIGYFYGGSCKLGVGESPSEEDYPMTVKVKAKTPKEAHKTAIKHTNKNGWNKSALWPRSKDPKTTNIELYNPGKKPEKLPPYYKATIHYEGTVTIKENAKDKEDAKRKAEKYAEANWNQTVFGTKGDPKIVTKIEVEEIERS